jgi:MFS family permease
MRLPPFLRDNARWLAGGFLLTLFSSYGQTFYIALSSGGIRDELGLSHGDFGWLYMWATLAGAATIPLAGRFADTVQIERYAAIVIIGLAASMLLLSQARTLPLLFVAIAGLRLFGQGLMSHAAMTAMGRWFSLNRGKAVSTAAMGHQFGESVMPVSFVALSAVRRLAKWLDRQRGLLSSPCFARGLAVMRVPREPHAAETQNAREGRQWTRSESAARSVVLAADTGIIGAAGNRHDGVLSPGLPYRDPRLGARPVRRNRRRCSRCSPSRRP